jgi:hypothetical protein
MWRMMRIGPSGSSPADLPSDRVQFKKLPADVSARLVAFGSIGLGDKTASALDTLRRFSGGNHRRPFCGSDDLGAVNSARDTYADGPSHVSGDINLSQLFPWTKQRAIADRRPVAVPRVVDLPPGQEVERASSEALGAPSSVCILGAGRTGRSRAGRRSTWP